MSDSFTYVFTAKTFEDPVKKTLRTSGGISSSSKKTIPDFK